MESESLANVFLLLNEGYNRRSVRLEETCKIMARLNQKIEKVIKLNRDYIRELNYD